MQSTSRPSFLPSFLLLKKVKNIPPDRVRGRREGGGEKETTFTTATTSFLERRRRWRKVRKRGAERLSRKLSYGGKGGNPEKTLSPPPPGEEEEEKVLFFSAWAERGGGSLLLQRRGGAISMDLPNLCQFYYRKVKYGSERRKEGGKEEEEGSLLKLFLHGVSSSIPRTAFPHRRVLLFPPSSAVTNFAGLPLSCLSSSSSTRNSPFPPSLHLQDQLLFSPPPLPFSAFLMRNCFSARLLRPRRKGEGRGGR